MGERTVCKRVGPILQTLETLIFHWAGSASVVITEKRYINSLIQEI